MYELYSSFDFAVRLPNDSDSDNESDSGIKLWHFFCPLNPGQYPS